MNTAQTSQVVDVSLENFEKEVVERSKTTPVLVDFWATWCGPCKTLGPILEKVAKESAGRFVLAKVDIDRNPELADAFGVQSVPSVILMKGGRPIDGFLGAQPEAGVRKFVEKHVGAPPIDYLAKAKELDQAGQRADAIRLLRARTREAHDDVASRLLLAKLLVADDKAEEARLIFDKLSESDRATDEGASLARALAFAAQKGELAALESSVAAAPGDLAARIAYGKALVASGKHEDGLAVLWKVATTDLSFDHGAPRKALIEVFDVIGLDKPLVAEYQRKLSILLCP